MTPHGCRLRDLTYAGRIYVDVKYVMDRKIMTAKNVPIGLMPLMLRSSRCVLHGKNNAEMAKASNFHPVPASRVSSIAHLSVLCALLSLLSVGSCACA